MNNEYTSYEIPENIFSSRFCYCDNFIKAVAESWIKMPSNQVISWRTLQGWGSKFWIQVPFLSKLLPQNWFFQMISRYLKKKLINICFIWYYRLLIHLFKNFLFVINSDNDSIFSCTNSFRFCNCLTASWSN